MLWLAVKYLVTAAVVVAVSEVARRSDKLGALIAALPLVTVLVLVWLQVEGQSNEKIGNHAYYTFWYVLPTLPMFLAFPWLLQRLGFWLALGASVVLTVVVFLLFSVLLRRFGVELVA
ncbi:DUF3147 family protein [Rubrivivax albus]|uniref:DUF3147 family protein n=1 Tax=Rubrivivax albus TaxID=2499835 RepID=A0A3S3S7B3_9BURK|nr:DUF3147 family protein [Rubrivivax albus]RVT47232.1 DUF3147 family protein [Rubrivivax albus]